MAEIKPLSKKHKRVLDEYLVCFKQVDAYQKVYPSTTYDSAKAAASKLFTSVNFSAHLKERLDEAQMSADEAIKRLSDMARGDVGEFIDNFGSLSLDEARKKGLTPLIKKIKQRTTIKNGKEEDTETHDLEIELYDAQSAIEKILKVRGDLKPDTTELIVRVVRASDVRPDS